MLAGVGLCVAVGRPWAYEQEIEILNPAQEQRIDILEGGEQRVAVVDAQGEQQVVLPEEPSAAKSAAMNAAKGTVAVLSVGISLASIAATLLFL